MHAQPLAWSLTDVLVAWRAQNVRLYSPDGQVFINTQADGNCVLWVSLPFRP